MTITIQSVAILVLSFLFSISYVVCCLYITYRRFVTINDINNTNDTNNTNNTNNTNTNKLNILSIDNINQYATYCLLEIVINDNNSQSQSKEIMINNYVNDSINETEAKIIEEITATYNVLHEIILCRLYHAIINNIPIVHTIVNDNNNNNDNNNLSKECNVCDYIYMWSNINDSSDEISKSLVKSFINTVSVYPTLNSWITNINEMKEFNVSDLERMIDTLDSNLKKCA